MSDPTPKELLASPKNKLESQEEAQTIEEIARKYNVATWAAAALKVRQGWPIGKKMLPSEYKSKLDDLLNGHTDGEK